MQILKSEWTKRQCPTFKVGVYWASWIVSPVEASMVRPWSSRMSGDGLWKKNTVKVI